MWATNGPERYHEEVKRRNRVVRIFLNRASCLRLILSLAMEQSKEWITGRRYLRMETIEEESIPVEKFEPTFPEVILRYLGSYSQPARGTFVFEGAKVHNILDTINQTEYTTDARAAKEDGLVAKLTVLCHGGERISNIKKQFNKSGVFWVKIGLISQNYSSLFSKKRLLS